RKPTGGDAWSREGVAQVRAFRKERTVNVLEIAAVVGGQQKSMSLDEPVLDLFQILPKQRLAAGHVVVGAEERRGCRRALETRWPRARKEARQKIGAIVGHFEDCLEQKVLDHVLAPD